MLLNYVFRNLTKKILTVCFFLASSFYARSQNPVITENALPGDALNVCYQGSCGPWEGFATELGVNIGDTVHFKINGSTDQAFYLKMYRLGYYQGIGAKLKATVGPFTGISQPAPNHEIPTSKVDCENWAENASWVIPSNIVSGFFQAVIVDSATGSDLGTMIFIVRDDAYHSNLLYKTADGTWQAYNSWGGYNFYGGGAPGPPALNHAAKLSYQRPYSGVGGQNFFGQAELPLIRWMERNGYDVSYTTQLDMSKDSNAVITPTMHKILISAGHDEYWSSECRKVWETARGQGVNLCFFSGNEIYWKTRWEDNFHTLVCYKEGTLGENQCGYKCDPSPEWTGLWRDGCATTYNPSTNHACLPENALTGQISWVNGVGTINVTDTYKNMRFWKHTAIENLGPGQSVNLCPNAMGSEWDQYQYASTYPPGRIILSTTQAQGLTHNLSLYRHSSGALVFGAGTIRWSWGLYADHEDGPSVEDHSTKQATVNLFAFMGVPPEVGQLEAGLFYETGAGSNTPPVSVITSPLNGSTLSSSPVTITGTASAPPGAAISSIEVSTNGGTTWIPATGTTNWTYSWNPSQLGAFDIRVRGFDDLGNMEVPGPVGSSNHISVTYNGPTSASVFTPNLPGGTGPTNGAGGPLEVGMRFKSSTNGYITSLKYFKVNGTTGVHTGNLWSNTGTLLATATFTNETTSGWQTATLTTPYAITAETLYVVSYFSPSGQYPSSTLNYFTADVVNPPLTAPGAGNGLYIYNATSAFPGTSTLTNYWVDINFTSNLGPDVTPPTVNSTTPPNNTTGVLVGILPSATFSEALDATTVNTNTFLLTGPGTTPVAGSVGYNTGTNTATFTPTIPLLFSTTYTVKAIGGASGIKDIIGNELAADYTWTFTTESLTAPAVTVHPLSQIVCSGSSVSLTSAATGSPIPTVQWQVSTDNGNTWQDILGATSSTYTFTAANGDNNNQYHAVWTNSQGSDTSNAATLTVTSVNPTGGAWYNNSWQYRRPTTISNTCGSTLTSYQVLVSLDNTFDFSKAKSDGSDIRVTDADGTTLIPFWIESWDSVAQQAKIWIKIPSILSCGSVAYLYYGNAAATSASDGTATFILFDDVWTLPGSNNWTLTGSPTVSNGIISFASGQAIESPGTYATGNAMGIRANYKGAATFKWAGFITGSVNPFTVIETDPLLVPNLVLANATTVTKDIASLGPVTNAFHVYELGWLSGETRTYIDHGSTPAVTINTQVPAGPLPLAVNNYNDVTYGLDVDWVYLRKFASCNPSSIVGAEQTPCPPPAPGVSSPVSYCQGTTAIALTATGSNLLWYTVTSGGIGNSTAPTPSTATPVTTSYYVSQTIFACEGPRAQIDVVVNPLPGAPSATVTQPTCGTPTGTITVTSGVSGLTFSIDGSTYTNTTGIFSRVNPGNYDLTARDITTGCISSVTPVVVNTVPGAPAAPTANVTQPTCTVATGTITITAPTDTGMTYSKDGINYFSSNIFSSVAPGIYSLTAKDSSGCISPITSKTVDPAPAVPSAPTANVAQPTCSLATGTITVSSTISGLAFSIDGSTYTNTTGVFAGVAPGTYNLTAKNIASTCISPVTVVTVNPGPPLPTGSISAVNSSLCFGTSSYQLQLTAATGQSPYSLVVNGTTYPGVIVGQTFATLPVNESFWNYASAGININPDPNGYELGVKFKATSNGYILGIRFYKGAGNTGTHIGSLWSNTGIKLATATFTNETTTGWQEVYFTTPVAVTANTVYVASYTDPNGHYSKNDNYFISGPGASGLTSGNLFAFPDTDPGAPTGNGLYNTALGAFPNSGHTGANYWVDVVFSTSNGSNSSYSITSQLTNITAWDGCSNTGSPLSSATVTVNPIPVGTISSAGAVCEGSNINLVYNSTAGTGPFSLVINGTNYPTVTSGVPFSVGTAGTNQAHSIWPNGAGITANADAGAVNLGVKFRSSVSGQITGIRFYKHALQAGTFTGTLWSSAGTNLATATFTTTASGWQQVNFTTPVTILPNTTYIASYLAPNGKYYSEVNYFATNSITNGALTALQNGVDGTNGLYMYSSTTAFPSNPTGTNYWVDVVFVPDVNNYFELTSVDANGCIKTGNPINAVFATVNSYIWSGGTNSSWNTVSNWSSCGVPPSGANVTIATTGTNPTLPSDITVGRLTINAGSIMNIGSNTLTINGAVSGAGTIRGSATSNLTIGGTGALGTLNFDQTTDGTTNALNDVIVNRTSSGTLSLGNKLVILNSYTPTAGILTTAGFLHLRSTATKTAYVAAGASGGGYISGNVTVERYTNDKRAWRLLSIPASGQTIKQAWMENAVNAASNPNPNFGTHITTYAGDANAANFDAEKPTSSIRTFANPGGTWSATPNTTSLINAQQGYMLFVRGNRTVDLNDINAHTAATLRITGTLKQGTQSSVSVPYSATDYTLVGNPFASPIDYEYLYLNTSPALSASFYVWDANLAGTYAVGGYRLVTRTGTGTYEQTPVVAGGPLANNTMRYINSGQAFLANATSGGGTASLVISEASKATAVSNIFPFTPTTIDEEMTINMSVIETDLSVNLTDGIRAKFNSTYSAGVTEEDNRKINNFNENLGITRDGEKLIVERRPVIGTTDTIYLSISNMQQKDYQLDINTTNLNHTLLLGKIVDNFTATSSPVNLNGNTIFNFTVTSDPASSAADRFKVIFYTGGPLPVTFTSIKAVQQANDIAVEWKVENQTSIKQYEVEKSLDGRSFTNVSTKMATGANGTAATYNWLDVHAVSGDNFYRVKSVGFGGDVQYTRIVKVRMGKGEPAITVYPVPVTDRVVTLQFTDMVKGNYTINLVNDLGQTVQRKLISHSGANAAQSFEIDRGVAKGNYQLQVVKPGGEKEVMKLVIAE